MFLSLFLSLLKVEIAEMISFNETTYTRAFVEYYQTGTDELQIDWRPFEGYHHYYKKDYYLKKRSYGTYELIIAQMMFKDNTIRNAAQSLHLSPPLLSGQIEVIGEAVTIPETIRVSQQKSLNLSLSLSLSLQIV